MTLNVVFVVYEGFNELDTFAGFHGVQRACRHVGDGTVLESTLVSATPRVRSMYGVELTSCKPLDTVTGAAAVVIGSGGTLAALNDDAFIAGLRLDASRQLIAAQCSGALVLERLGHLSERRACVDKRYRPHLEASGVTILDQPFQADGNVATAGGCLASPYLSTWILWRLVGRHVATQTLASLTPAGRDDDVERILSTVERFV